MNDTKKAFDNLSELSEGCHSLEEVLRLAKECPAMHIETQPRNKREVQEDHVMGDVLDDIKYEK